jgi:hypothetical protein
MAAVTEGYKAMARKKITLTLPDIDPIKLAIGAGALLLIIIVAVLVLSQSAQLVDLPATRDKTTPTPAPAGPVTSTPNISWTYTADGYVPNGVPPYCPDKIVEQFPADPTQATSVAYPGQLQGDIYRTDGVIRFGNNPTNLVNIKAPFDGKIIGGAAYLPTSGAPDVQYVFDVMNDCGMMYRIGSLLTLSPQLAGIAQSFPPPTKGVPVMTPVDAIPLKAGTLMATAVGTVGDHKVYLDWGVYDWRTVNALTRDPLWIKDPRHLTPMGKHAICWLTQLPTSNLTTTVSGLPADSKDGQAAGDYCKQNLR